MIMFTLDQIKDIHDHPGKQSILPQFLPAHKAMGVET